MKHLYFVLLIVALFQIAGEASADTVKIVTIGDSITEADPTYNAHSYRPYLAELLHNSHYDFEFVGSRRGFTGGPLDQCYQNTDVARVGVPGFSDLAHESRASRQACEYVYGIQSSKCKGTFAPTCGAEKGRNLRSFIRYGMGENPGYDFDAALIHIGTNDLWGYGTSGARISNIDVLVGYLKNIVATLRNENPDVAIFLAKIIPNFKETAANNGVNALNDRIPCLAAELYLPNSPVMVVDHNSGFRSDMSTDMIHPNESGARFMAATWFYALAPALDESAMSNDTEPLLRYLKSGPVDNFYTINYGELGCGNHGWNIMLPMGYIYRTQQPGTVRLIRYFNAVNTDHFYTVIDYGPNIGDWKKEGTAGYVYPPSGGPPGTVPLYRFWNDAPGVEDHFYTTVKNPTSIINAGWKPEGIACYVHPDPW